MVAELRAQTEVVISTACRSQAQIKREWRASGSWIAESNENTSKGLRHVILS